MLAAKKVFLKNPTLRPALMAVIALSFVCCEVCAQEPDSGDVDHAVVREVGSASEWSVHGGGRPNCRGTVAAEVTPIENLFELESPGPQATDNSSLMAQTSVEFVGTTDLGSGVAQVAGDELDANLRDVGVAGSNPVTPTIDFKDILNAYDH
jgi:hypothetical protein